ncbi:MAG: HXXEE domain-containing protein [Anaerolineaceae bacterium]|nr:HXXEE domain-containing protein [Anaerolineaceae bacterium]
MTTTVRQSVDKVNHRYLLYTQLMNGVLALVGVGITIWILMESSRLTNPDIAFWLIMPVGLLHTVEEYILPGGFIPWFNHTVCYSSDDFLPLSARRAFITDGSAALFILPVLILITIGVLPIWIAFFMAMALFQNAYMHLGEMIKQGRYSPGVITSVLLIIPVYSWLSYFYMTEGIISPLELAGAFTAGAFMNGIFYTFLRNWIRTSVAE